MALHNNNGQGWKTIPDLIKAIREIAPMFSARELRTTIADMHKYRYAFNDCENEKENVTVIICDKGKTGYYFGLEGIQS